MTAPQRKPLLNSQISAEARRIAHNIPDRLLQPTVDYWHGRLLLESTDPINQSRGWTMLESAFGDFRTHGMVLHAAFAERALAADV